MSELGDVWSIFLQTSWQASLSAALALGIGLFISFGLINLKSQKIISVFEIIFISPQILPALFILLATYQIYALFESAPAGFYDVVLIHVLINAGFCGVQLARIMKVKIGGFAELAQVEGASAGLFVKAIVPYLRRDLIQIFFTVFVFCFLSFSIPVVIGGRGSETLEVLIYKKILSDARLDLAMKVSVFQFVAIAIIGWFLNSKVAAVAKAQSYRSIGYGSKYFLILPTAVIALLYFFTFKDAYKGAIEIYNHASALQMLMVATKGTFVSAFSSGAVVFLLSVLLAYVWPQPILAKVTFVLTPPSLVFIGLLCFVAGWSPSNSVLSFAFLGFLLALTFFFSLYRFGLASLLEGLAHQAEVARSLGASRLLVLRQVMLPQLMRHLCYFAGIAAFWSAGDFALSLFIVPVESNLALFVKMLLSRYKLEMATAVLCWMMVVGYSVFIIFKGIGSVANRKFS